MNFLRKRHIEVAFRLDIKQFPGCGFFWTRVVPPVLQNVFFFFFLNNCYLAVPQPTLGHSQGDTLTNPMLITAFVQVRPESHREPRNEVGSLSTAERLVGFDPGTFRFWLQRLNPLGHSKQQHQHDNSSLWKADGRFIEKNGKLRREKRHRANQVMYHKHSISV